MMTFCMIISNMTLVLYCCIYVFFFKQKTAYEMRISDWSSDVCSSDLDVLGLWKELSSGLRAAASKYGGRIATVGVDTWGVDFALLGRGDVLLGNQIGRAAWRERVCQYVVNSVVAVILE